MAITCALGTKHIEALAKVIYKKMSTLPQGEVFDINGYMDYLYTKLAEKQGVDSALQYMQQFPYLANIIAAKLIDVVDIDPSVNLAAMAKAFRNPDTGWQEVNARFNRELTPEVLDAVSDYEANTPTQQDYEDEVPTPIAKVSDDRLKATTALSGTLEQFITMNPNDKFEGVVESTDPNKTYIRLALAKIKNLARNLDINATINYQGKFLRLKVVNLKDFPRDERTQQTDDLIGKMIGIGEEESIKNDVTPISQLFALMLTDENGNTIYFNQQGDVTTKEKGGKPVYQMMRDVRLQNGKYTVRDIYNKEDQIMTPTDLAYEMLRFMGYGSVSSYEKNENASFADLVKDLGKQQQEEFKKLYDLKQQALKGKAPLLFVTGASTGILNDVIKQDVKLSDLEGLAPNTIDTFLVLNKDEYGFRSGASIITVDDQSFQVDRIDIPKDISKQIAQALQSKTLKTKEKVAFYNQFFNDKIVNLQSKINNQDFSFVTDTRRHKLIQKNNKLYFVYADYTAAELKANPSLVNTLRYVPLDGSKQSTDKIQEVLNGGKASVKEGKVTKYGAKMNYMNGILNSDFFTYDETNDKLVKSGTYKEFIVGLNPKILLSKSQGLPLYNSYLKFAIPDAYSNKAAKAQQKATQDTRSAVRKFKDDMVEVIKNAPAQSIKITVQNVREVTRNNQPPVYNYDAVIEGQPGVHKFYGAKNKVNQSDEFYLEVTDVTDNGFLFKDVVKALSDTEFGRMDMGSLGDRDFNTETSRGIPIETITAAETEVAEALDELKPEPNTVPDEDIEGDQKELLNPDNTIQPSDSTPISRRLKRDYGKFKLDRGANLSNDVTQEQIDAATTWWNNSPLSKFISLEQVANIVNSNVYARFIAAGSSLLAEQNLDGKLGKILINQATKGSMVDTYHEAWHVFSQLFLTREEKLKLYNEVRNSDPKFKNLSAFAIEEILAEDFRTYALSPKTKKGAPVRNTLFRRILNFLKKLFSRKQSLADQIQPEEISTYGVAGELFNKLFFASNKPELLNDYVPLIENVQFDMLNRGIRQQRAYREDALNERDSLDLVNAMDSMISEEIDNAYAYQKESNGVTANKSGTVNIILKKENEAQLYEFLKENLEDRVAEIKNRLTVAPVKPFNDINTLVDLSTNAIAVIKNSKGDNEYFFLRDQIEDFDNLTLDNKEGERIKGELYKGTIDVIGDFYTHNKIKGTDKTPANIVIVNSLEEAKAQFEAYVKAKETDYTDIVENPNASATQAVLDFDQKLDLERLRIFQTALKNWNKTIKFHKEHSDFNIINKKVRLQESDPALDPEEATNDIEDAAGGEKLKDSVGDVTLQQLADNEVIYMLKSLFALDKDGNHQYDRLGFKKRASFKKVWNALVRSTGSTKDPQEIYNKIVAASAIYPELKQLVEYKLPNPSVEDPINGTSFSITTSFWNAFSLPRIKYIQLLVVPEKDGTTTEVVGTSMDIGSTKRKFTSQFRAQKPNKFISKDKFNNNILNLNAIVKEFIGDDGQLKTGDDAEYRFLKAIGFNYDDLGKIKQTLSDKIIRKDYALGYIFTVFKELRDAQSSGNVTEEGWEIINRFKSNPIDALSKGFGKGIIGAPNSSIYLEGPKLSTAVNKLIELQNKYGATSSNFSVLNAAKKRVNEHTKDNTLTVIADALNSATEKTELFRKGSITSYLDPKRNPWTNNLQTFNSLFDASNKKRAGRSIAIEMASGTQILNKDGSTTTDLDPRSKFIQEFHTMLKAGMQEVLRPGSKSSSFAWRIDGGIEFPGIGSKKDKHLYIDFDTFLSMNNELDAIEKIILPYVSSETARINIFKTNPEAKNYIGYNKPGKDGKPSGEQFNYFDGVLSKETKQEILSKVNTTEVTLLNYLSSDPKLKETIIKEIQSYFEKKSNKLYDYLNEAKYIDPKLLNKYNIPGFTGSQKERLLTKTYMYNSWIHNLETSVIFYGDIAQYDHTKQGFHKRTSGLISNGRRFRTDVSAIRYINEQFNLGKTYASTLAPKYNNFIYDGSLNTAIIEEIKRDSVYIPDIRDGLTKFYTENTKMSADEIKKTVDREIKKYTKEEIKEGDGQGYITFDAYRTLKKLQNKWSDKQEDLFQKIIKGEPIEGPLDEFFPVYKLQNFGYLEDTVLPVTAFHKFALFPLIPSVIKEGSDFDKLHKKMLEQNIQYVTFESGSKVGAITSNGKPDKAFTEDGRFNDSVVFTKNTFNAGFLKEVTNVPNKYKGNVVFPTQLRKLILDGLYEEGALTLPKYSGLVKAYEESVKFNTELLKEELKQEIGYDETKGITNPEKFLKVIKDNLRRKDYPEHLLRALKTNSDGSLKYDLSYFLDAQAIEDTIMSIVEKKFVRQKVKGEALVQVASSFTNNMWTAPTDADIKKHMGSNTLPFYHPGKDGKTNAMKVAISLQGDFYHLLKLKHIDGEAIGTIQRLNQMIKDDKWLDTDNNRKSITMTAVRIPVQGLNSMEFMEVYEFLDPSAGSIIIVPTELVAKSGGDFDVDKLTTFMPNINSETGEVITSNLSREEFFAAYNKATDAEKKEMLKQQKKAVENSFIENIRSILEIPENYATLVKPNDTALLQGLSEELEDKVSDFDKYEKVNGEEVNISGKGTKMISPTTVLEPRYNVAKHGHNIVGKAVLGIAASENAMNPIFNQAGVILPKKYKASEFSKSLSKYVEFGEPIYDMRLFLPHNKTKSGNISLSKIYDETGIDRIADVVSQGMNGWVDVEANEWIFYIQGNYELAPTMLYLIRSGVPREYAVKFVSSPLIREFAEELRKISGPFAGAMGIAAKEKAFERYEATKRVIDRHMREYYNASTSVLQPNDDVTVYYKTFVPNQGWIDIPTKMKYSELRNNINGLIYDLNNVSSVTIDFDGKEREVYVKPSVDNKLFYNSSSKANERYETSGYSLELMDNLIDSYAKTGTVDQNQIIPAMGMLLHFSEIQKQIQGIGRMKRRSKPDTTLFRNIQEIALRDLDIDSLDTLSKVDKASKDRILYESITSSLGDKKLIVDVVSQMLPLRNGEPTDEFIKTALSDEQYKTAIINKFGASNDGLVNFVSSFKNDISNFILQNYLSNFIDANGSIVKIPTEFKEMPVKLSNNLLTDVEIKDGVVYVNSQNLREDFANKSYLDTAEGPRSYAQRPGFEPFKTEQDPFASEEAYIKYAIFRSYMQTKGYTGLELNKIALLNSFNYNALMRNNDYSYTNEVMDVIQKYPNLAIDYPILEQISIHSTSKSTEFNVLTLTDRDVIDAATKDTYARNIRALGNESVQKVEDTKENLRISRLFHMLPLVAIYQHGVGSTLYGFDQVLPQDMVQSAMQNASNLFKLNYWNTKGLAHVFKTTVNTEERQFKNFVVTEAEFNQMPELRAVAAEEDPFEAIENAPTITQPTTKPTEVKSGVQEIFESNPELSNIGSQEQYSQYLNSIFPNSQIKDILYHGTSAYKLGDVIPDFQNRALYLANKKMAQSYAGKTGVVLPVIINSQVLINSPELIGELPETLAVRKEQLKNAKLAEQNKGFFAVNRGIFSVDDIILGEQDIEYYLTEDAYSNRRNQRFEALTGEDLTKFIKFLENRITEIEAGRPIDSFITRADGDPEDFYGVFNPKNVLFLGSTQDIEGFRNFVKNTPVVNQSPQAKTTDDYRYFGSMYTIKLQDGVGVDVEGYKGKAAAKQKLLDAYNTDPNVDPQNGRPFRETPTQLEVQAQNSGNTFVFANGIAIDVPFTLNAEQQAALYKLEDFYNNPAKYKNEITLSGYAGTGKTTILGIFDKYLNKKSYVKPIYTSPTHRANAVTQMKNPKAKVVTLHSLFGLNPMLNLESDQLDIRDVKTESVRKPNIKRGDTIIVDESSMVTNELYDLIQEFKDDMNLKIIFAGDRGQLGPVQNDTKLQSKVFDNSQNQIQLTKVERTGDNPILLNSTRAREGQDFTYITDEIDGNGVEFFDTPDRLNQIMGQNLKEMKESDNPLYFRILSSLNKDVARINIQAREIMFGAEAKKSPYIEGEILMGYDNIGEDELINSGDYVVKSVSEVKDIEVSITQGNLTSYGIEFSSGKKVKVKGYTITIQDALNSNKDPFQINVPTEGNDEALAEIAKGILDLKALFSKLQGKARGLLFGEISLLTQKIVFNKDIIENGRFLAKKGIDYGYAHTIHKSQGGTYNKVLIFDDSISSLAANLADKRKLGMDGQKAIKDQLKYVAISRASEYAYVYNPKDTAVGGYDFRGETPQPITEEDYDTAAVATFSFATVEEKPTPAVPTKGEIELRSDNVDKVFSGNKTITNRTSLINDGKYSIKGSTDVVEIKYIGKSTINGNQVTITNEKTGKVSTRTLDQLAKAEGFKDAADFKANNKFSTNYLNGTQSRYLYQITPVFAVSADAEAAMGRINPETSTDLQDFRDAVAQNNNIFPAKFTSAAGRVYVLNSDGLYNLVDPLSGTTLMKNIDLTTGEMGVPSNVNVPATNAYKNELLKQIQTYIKDFNLEEILGQYGYDVKDLIEKVQNAETQDQVDEVAALINEKICKS
jgi:exodeoxyribonuclease-5